jgi:hypothetical protein
MPSLQEAAERRRLLLIMAEAGQALTNLRALAIVMVVSFHSFVACSCRS